MASSRIRYTPLYGEETVKTRISLRNVAVYGVLVVVTATVGFLAGWYTARAAGSMVITATASGDSISCMTAGQRKHSLSTDIGERVVDAKPHTFRYNRTFSSAPSPVTDEAWEQLFPAHHGFFSHPTIAPARSAFSAFHELHCLVRHRVHRPATCRLLVFQRLTERQSQDGLRKSLYADGTLPGEASAKLSRRERDAPGHEMMETAPAHVRHCIDLLRQSIMCRPDLTVEVKDAELGGVTGFGTTHQCKDWDQLKAWVAEWEEIGAPNGR